MKYVSFAHRLHANYCACIPAPLPKPIEAYMSSIVLLRGTLPVDLNDTSSVLTVRGGPSMAEGVFGEDAWEEEGELFLGAGDVETLDRAGGLLLLLFVLLLCWTTSSFHFFTIDFALMASLASLCVLSFPIALPMSVFCCKSVIFSTSAYLLLSWSHTFNNSPVTLILPKESKISKHVYGHWH